MNMHDRQCHNIKHSASLWFFHAYSVALPLNNSGDCNSCRLCRHLVNGYDLRILAKTTGASDHSCLDPQVA